MCRLLCLGAALSLVNISE